MSLDPLATIILLIYFITVLTVLVVWFVVTFGSRSSQSLTKVQQLVKNVQSQARVKRETVHSPVKAKKRRTRSNDGFNSYRHRRKQASSRERNFRVFSGETPLPNQNRPKEPLVANKSLEQTDKRQNYNDFYTKSIDSEKNLTTPSKSVQKLSNNEFRGEGVKKQPAYSSIDLNFEEDFLKDFAKNKK